MHSYDTLLDITGDDIAQLNDTDLRTLVGRLCECDFHSENLPVAGIIWGGNQDAGDGGLDVSVSSDKVPARSSFVPRNHTGFQVKKPDMPRAAILNEMKPKGILRPSIKSLIQSRGAYIITSANGSTTGKAIKDRVEAMREAISHVKGSENLHIDFYDRSRLATWVQSHPSMVLWVREKIGKSFQGWQPYGNWSNSPGGLDEEYLVDDKLRLLSDSKRRDEGTSIKDGIVELRGSLSIPRASIRLVGLSGVGKTRLVQALFDERIGDNALNPFLAYYTDISYSPFPDPGSFAEQLIAKGQRAILVVDNCTPDLHRRLTTVCAASRSQVSLITVEYDVKEDIPEQTSVFRLQPASETVIENLISKRYPHISQVDARIIAKFSDGNARVAIALSNNVQIGETLSGFKDADLFRRLFQQRNDPSNSLLLSAKACSVLYSFDGIDISDNSELKILASFTDVSIDRLFRDIKELKDRELMQSRGQWRAILPHAIANWLARQSIESIPKGKLVSTILESGSERLIKSFTRRLSYLHDSEVAAEIAADWLSEDGWIGKAILNLSDFGFELFKNLAPICPKGALEAIQRGANHTEKGQWFTSTENPKHYEFADLVRKLAYECELFNASAILLACFALSEKVDENNGSSARNALKSLFYIYLSGTHATLEERSNVINELLNSQEEEKQSLGLLLLEATLEASQYTSYFDFSFGARSRDFGFSPTYHESISWFKTFIDICKDHILSNKTTSQEAKKLLSDRLWGLWIKREMYDEIEETISSVILNNSYWNEGWISILKIRKFMNGKIALNILSKLNRLEEKLRPKTLEDEIEAYVLAQRPVPVDLLDNSVTTMNFSDRVEFSNQKIVNLGLLASQDTYVLDYLLPELTTIPYGRVQIFGQGLAEGCSNKTDMWGKLSSQFKIADKDTRQINLMLGFLFFCGDSDPEIFDHILESILNDDILCKWFPAFLSTSKIGQKGLNRLNYVLDFNKSEVSSFNYLSSYPIHDSIDDINLATLLHKISKKENGLYVVYEILTVRFNNAKIQNPTYPKSLLKIACLSISKYKFNDTSKNNDINYNILQIATVCLMQDGFNQEVRQLCQNLCEAIAKNRIKIIEILELYPIIINRYLKVFLDVFLNSKKIEIFEKHEIFSSADPQGILILNIPDKEFENWCDKDPKNRYPLLIQIISTFTKPKNSENLEWRPIVYSILNKAQNLASILEELAQSTHQSLCRFGERPSILRTRIPLFEQLFGHHKEEVRFWANNQIIRLNKEIEAEQEFYNNRIRQVDESFE